MRDSTIRYPNPHEDQFAEWARSEGWRVTKQGWPDFICRRGDEVMAVEVKGGNDGLRPDQVATIRDLRAAGMPAFLWTPESGMVEVMGTPLTESIPALQAEIVRLHGVIRQMSEAPRPLSQPTPVAPRVRLPNEEAACEAQISEWCRAAHPTHDRGEGRLPLCTWVMRLSDRMPDAQVAKETGLEVEEVDRLVRSTSMNRERFLHRERHRRLNQMGVRCEECKHGAA